MHTPLTIRSQRPRLHSAEPCACNASRGYQCGQRGRHEIGCVTDVKGALHAEPFACVRPRCGSRALRLPLLNCSAFTGVVFRVCKGVAMVHHGLVEPIGKACRHVCTRCSTSFFVSLHVLVQVADGHHWPVAAQAAKRSRCAG